MSLLDNASLLLTPNAYKEGKLYSVIPSNGNGDFTATRATTATRVNSAGLVDLVPYNLVGYSEMFTDASWTKSNVTISANSISAPNGTLTADTLTGNGISGSHGVLNGFTPVISTTYTLSCYFKANTNNFVQITAAASAFGSSFFANFDIVNGTIGSYGATALNPSIENVGSGWYRISVSGVALTGSNVGAIGIYLVSSNSAIRLETNTLSTSVFIWGAQIVEGTSARDYLRTETRLNIPRVDYSLGGCPNILLEPQRTNLALQSSSFDNASWGKTRVDVTANSTTSPSGIVDADTITANATGAGSVVSFASGGAITVTSGVRYTISLYAKKGNQNWLIFNIGNSANTTYSRQWFNISTGVLGSTSTVGGGLSAQNATITSVGNGWYRCSFDVLTNDTGLRGGYVLTNADATFSATLGDTIFLWGAQLEAGAYATSYIPTTTASVTRNADSITRNNIFTNGLITAAGGTWFVELRNNVARVRDAGSTAFGIGNNAALTDNSLLFISPSSGRITFRKTIGGTATSLFSTTTDVVKLAVKWNGSTADVFVNGVKQVSATAFAITNMEFINCQSANVPYFINEMALFPTALTDAQCIALTQ